MRLSVGHRPRTLKCCNVSAAAAHATAAAVRDASGSIPTEMSQRDLMHVRNALWQHAGADHAGPVATATIDDAIGRRRGDMRTPLNLRSLVEEGHVVAAGDRGWKLTPAGIAWVKQDRELSDR